MRCLIALLLAALTLPLSAQTQTVTVVELHQAPGQFVNELPKADDETTQELVCKRATRKLAAEELVSLGTYGGYITVKFDHAVENKPGSDLRITGNGFYAAADPVYGAATIGGSFEPGIVYVGVGDSLETAQWYELAGSEYYTTEVHDFRITYYKPTSETGSASQFGSSYDNYIRWRCSWTDKDGMPHDSTGYHPKNVYHSQAYWPLYEDKDSLTFSGGKLPNNAIEQSGNGRYWVLYRYAKDAYGYVDCSLNKDDYSTFDIDWAVDSEGNHVDLERIDFVRVACGIFQYCGWIGETSTEVSGFTDLHLVSGYDDNPIYITPRTNPTGILTVDANPWSTADKAYYTLHGVRVDTPRHGEVYIHQGRKIRY